MTARHGKFRRNWLIKTATKDSIARTDQSILLSSRTRFQNILSLLYNVEHSGHRVNEDLSRRLKESNYDHFGQTER